MPAGGRKTRRMCHLRLILGPSKEGPRTHPNPHLPHPIQTAGLPLPGCPWGFRLPAAFYCSFSAAFAGMNFAGRKHSSPAGAPWKGESALCHYPSLHPTFVGFSCAQDGAAAAALASGQSRAQAHWPQACWPWFRVYTLFTAGIRAGMAVRQVKLPGILLKQAESFLRTMTRPCLGREVGPRDPQKFTLG